MSTSRPLPGGPPASPARLSRTSSMRPPFSPRGRARPLWAGPRSTRPSTASWSASRRREEPPSRAPSARSLSPSTSRDTPSSEPSCPTTIRSRRSPSSPAATAPEGSPSSPPATRASSPASTPSSTWRVSWPSPSEAASRRSSSSERTRSPPELPTTSSRLLASPGEWWPSGACPTSSETSWSRSSSREAPSWAGTWEEEHPRGEERSTWRLTSRSRGS
mmetsp:Transcript_23316/g.43815  ORF Transcript_23316/g.43815 Transcript_23316/m.43815 type:complete len:219 (+) Transcript_23316:1146-1802(+)